MEAYFMKKFLMIFILILGLAVSINAATKEWTWMVYMDGDCNLEADAINDFNEMASVGSTSDINIVVQFGRLDTTQANMAYYVGVGYNE